MEGAGGQWRNRVVHWMSQENKALLHGVGLLYKRALAENRVASLVALTSAASAATISDCQDCPKCQSVQTLQLLAVPPVQSIQLHAAQTVQNIQAVQCDLYTVVPRYSVVLQKSITPTCNATKYSHHNCTAP